MFAVAADGAIGKEDGPAIFGADIILWFAEGTHWFDADAVARLQNIAVAAFAVVRNFGVGVHFFADAVADVIFNYAEVATTQDALDSEADVAEMDAWGDLIDASPEGFFGGANHFLNGGIGVADDFSEGSIGVIAFPFNDEVETDFIAVF